MSELLALDGALLGGIHDLFSCPALDFLMPLITHLGSGGFLWLVMAAALLVRPKTRRAGLTIVLAMAICLVFGNGLLKNLIARPRPYTVDPSILLLISPSVEPYSFPSGHTMHSFAAACAIGIAGERRLFCFALPLAVLIGFSRLYLRMHFPLDVLAGALFGLFAALLADRLTAWLAALAEKKRAKG